MAGTALGGKKAAETNKAMHGEDFYCVIGAKSHAAWVANGKKPRGFSLDRERARLAGKLGGQRSRRSRVV